MKAALLLALVSITTIGVFLTGCHDDHDHAPAPAGATTKPASGGHDKDGHDHQHHGDGTKEMLGLVEVEGFEVSAVQNGKLVPGTDIAFDVEILGATKPTAVRFWVGPDATVGADRKKPPEQVKDGVHHVDFALPADFAVPGAKLFVEMERTGGAPVVASFNLVPPKN